MLQIQDLKFSIGQTNILNGIAFNVKIGEQLGIIGPNGSGKTTLFNCISGFNIPQSGSIQFKEKDITKSHPADRAHLGLGRVFQNFGIFREMTLLENIITALESKQGFSFFPWSKRHKTNIEQSLDYLSMVQLEKKAKDKAGSLSGGQMRLLEIIRAIAFEADLFLLDEPTAGVSPKMKGEIEKALTKLHELNKTVLIIEHDINFIQRLCERIIVLDGGKVVLDDTPEKVRNDKRLQEIYFGHNETNKPQLASAISTQ
jgi:ABC-type branched-subunit amino acid transport system ATPase component